MTIFKRILIVLAILTSFLLASCKKKEKDYVCKCADVSAPTYTFTIHDTQENAEKKCESTPAANGCGLQW